MQEMKNSRQMFLNAILKKDYDFIKNQLKQYMKFSIQKDNIKVLGKIIKWYGLLTQACGEFNNALYSFQQLKILGDLTN